MSSIHRFDRSRIGQSDERRSGFNNTSCSVSTVPVWLPNNADHTRIQNVTRFSNGMAVRSSSSSSSRFRRAQSKSQNYQPSKTSRSNSTVIKLSHSNRAALNHRLNHSQQNHQNSQQQLSIAGRSSSHLEMTPSTRETHSHRQIIKPKITTARGPRSRSSFLDEDFTFISPLIKYSLFGFNLIFWIIGASLVALGLWSFLEEYEYNMFKLRNVFDFILHISLSLILTGSIIFTMSFMGCLGALRENICLIKLYSLMLLLLFVAEVCLSTMAFIFPQSVLHFLKDRLSKDMITKYREDSNLQNLIDIVQMQLKCCGISDNGYKDWSMNIYFNCTANNPSSERCSVPFSCCRHSNVEFINSMCGYSMQNLSSVVEINKYVYTRSCVEALSELVDRNMNLVAIICLASALIQLFAMFLARSLQAQIFAQRTLWM